MYGVREGARKGWQSDFWGGFFNVSQDSESGRVLPSQEHDHRDGRERRRCTVAIKITGRALNVAVV